MFCFILFLLLNCSIINCSSLVGSRITSNSRINRIIQASLTDKNSGQVWQIEESIGTKDKITGRIEIKSTDTQSNVFYSYNSPKDNKKRLVIHDNICDLYNYDDLNWDKLLPGVSKPLTNLILLLGPSLLDRITAMDWKTGSEEIIRGSLMNSVSTDLDSKLNITLYYESYLNQMNGIQQPSQIVFTGYNPDTLVEGESETLILDIYLQSQTQQDLDKLVQATPGFGCPVYLNGDKSFPELNVVKIHFIAAEQVNNNEKAINEFHADETYQVLRQSELLYGFKREKLFDFSIGALYRVSSSGSCYASPIDSSTPGIDESGAFSISKLLWLSKTMKYLGEILFEHRSGYNVHVWESIETDRVINDESYDKVVTTQYMSSSYNHDIFKGYSLVAATIKAYKKNSKGSYVLSYTNHRDYYDSSSDLPESVYHEALQLEDCYEKSEQKLNLKFHLICKVDGCIQKSQDSVYEMKELFRSNLLGQLGISFTRVAYIDFKFEQDVIEADVTFVEAPEISHILQIDGKNIDLKSTKVLHSTVADSNEKCLRYHASFVPTGAAIIQCPDGNVCFSVANEKDVQESRSGTSCTVFTDPYKKLNKLGQEKPLSDLHDHILDYIGHITFNMDLDDKTKGVAFQVTDVIAVEENVKEQKNPFHLLYYGYKFDEIDGIHAVMVPEINAFGDCYRACSHNEDIPCETFTFCDSKDKKECYVSSWTVSQIKNNRTGESGCNIYAKDHLSDFAVRRELKFKNPATAFKESYLGDCAAECYSSKDCVSFEYCDRNKCSFSGLATSSNTESSNECDIYTPLRSGKYTVTGKKLVSQVLYTEVDLDLDQCATLCDDELACKSFNYCPKSKSSSQCQITSYSIKDPKTESVESLICHNFESKVKRNEEPIADNSPNIKASGISGGGVFGIIMLFLFIGLSAGFVGPYVFTKARSRDTNKSNDNYGWSKQEDEDESLTQIKMVGSPEN